MTCSRRLGRMLQASSLALIGMLTVVGCGGSDNPTNKDAGKNDANQADGSVQGTVTVAPALIDFGTVDVGSTSKDQTVTVTAKNGSVAVTPTVTGTGFAISSTTCAGTLAINASCAVAVRFAPAAIGASSGILSVGGVSVSLGGTGTQPGTFSATDQIPLGTVLANTAATAVVQIVPQPSVASLTCVASGADLTLATTTCTTPVATACSYTFTFKSATAGAKSENITCSGGGKTTTTVVTANVVTAASVAISPASGLFTATVGQTPDTVTFHVSNSGGSTSGLLSASITVGATDFTIASNDCVVPLAPLGVCNIQVAFNPASAGDKKGTLSVTDANAPTTPVTAALSGTAVTSGTVVVTPATADFGSIEVGQSSQPTTFTAKNSGGSATEALAISSSNAEFVVGSDTCSGLPLAAAGSCTFTVTFVPATAATGKKTVIGVTQTGGALLATASATGVGTAPKAVVLTLSPATLDFGTTGVGTTVGPKTFTVTNTGSTDSATLSVVKNDSTSSVGGASQFTYTTTCSAALAAGDSCQVVVTYAPTIKGSASALFTVTDGTVVTKAGTVVGIALDKPTLSVTCGSSAANTDVTASDTTNGWFNPGVVVGATSSAVVCTVKNDATSTQATGALTITPTGDYAAPAASNNCTASLAPGLSCIFSLTFKPTAKGTRNGTLTVSGANGVTTNLNLFGTGLGVVELVEYGHSGSCTVAAGAAPTAGCAAAVATAYDFAQVSVGTTSDSTKNLTLALFVRSSVGTVTLGETFGTPATFTSALVSESTASGCPASLSTSSTFTPVAGQVSTSNVYCAYTIQFTPKAKGAASATVTATGADSSTDTATVVGTGTGPLTIAPSPAAFGSVAVGSNTVITLTVTNKGAAGTITGTTLTLTGANADQFVVQTDNVTGTTIGQAGSSSPSDHATVLVRFAPTSTGAKTATITVSGTYNGASSETATVTLSGTGGAAAGLTATLTTAFPATAIRGRGLGVVTVTNNGGSASSAIRYSLPSGVTEFTTTPPSSLTQGTCGADNTTALAAGASCTIKVWFQPVAGLGNNSRASTLTVFAATGGKTTVALTGATTPELTITPATLQDFGSVVIGANATLTFTLTNNSVNATTVNIGSEANINSLTPSSAAQAATFTIVNNNCLAGGATAGGTCTFGVKWAPTTVSRGVSYATILATDANGTNEIATVDVKGTALAPAVLSFTGGTGMDHDFGYVAANGSSAIVTYTVTNSGDQASGNLAWSLLNGSTAYATTVLNPKATGTTCTTDTGVAAGASCVIAVQYTPAFCSLASQNAGTCTKADVDASLKVLASPGATAGITIANGGSTKLPELIGHVAQSDTTASVPYLVEQSTGVSPYDFGTLSTASGTVLTITMNMAANGAATTLKATSPVTITDVGGADAIAAQSGTAEFSILSSTCTAGGTVAAAASCNIIVTWAPGSAKAAGKRQVAVKVFDSSSALVADAVLLANKAVPAALTASAGLTTGTPVDFGTLLVDSTGTATVTITNTGDVATASLTATRNDTANILALTSANGCIGSTLAAKATCVLTFQVSPGSTNSVTVANEYITVSDGTVSVVVYMTWTAVRTAKLTLTPDTVSFGNVADGTTAFTTVAISNVANGQQTGALTVTVNSTDFIIAGNAPGSALDTTNDCAASKFAKGLAGGQSCNVYVIFAPTSIATPAKSGTVTVASAAAASATVALSGTAVTPLTATGTTSFSATVGSSADQTITIKNALTAPSTGFLSVVLSGANADQFRIVADTCTGTSLVEVDSGTQSSCTVTVRFVPTAAATSDKATLTVSGTPGDSVAASLTGAATAS